MSNEPKRTEGPLSDEQLKEIRDIVSKVDNDPSLMAHNHDFTLHNRTKRFLATIDALIADKERLVEALEGIKNYPPKGADRRTKDGYPEEIIYDEFAYKRIIDSYREGARKALRTVGEGGE